MTSPVWSYFVKVQVPSPTGGIEENTECKSCKDLLSAKSANGTALFKRHMDKCVPKTTNTTGVRGGLIQTPLSQTDSSGGLGVFYYDSNNARYQLIKFIIVRQLPFILVEDRAFERYHKSTFVPSWKKISRITTRNDAIKTFLKEK